MRRSALLIAGAVLCTALWAWQAKDAKAAVALQAAIKKEAVDGDLKGAIEQYKKIVQSRDHSVAARALVRMGQCYERLGDAEARKAYERVLRDFADQREAASQAHARLAALRPVRGEEIGPVITELKLDAGNRHYALSPDGMRLAYTDRTLKNLLIRDLATGAERRIATETAVGSPWWPIWSPDGKQIAFQRMANAATYEVRIVGLDTGRERGTSLSAYPLDWSRDGRWILYTDGGPDKIRSSAGLFPVSGGPVRRLDDVPAWGGARLSPDGRYVTYYANQEVFVMPLDGGQAVNITNDPAGDWDPLWTPDGKTMLFLSDRHLGKPDLWGVSMADGRPSGSPFLVQAGMENVELIGMSDNGRLLISRTEADSHIYVTAVDPATGRPSGPAMKLTKDSRVNDSPAVSPDGKRIAYLSARKSGKTLCVMDADGAHDREIAPVRPVIGPFVWAADSEHIYIAERRDGTARGIYAYSASTRETKPVLLNQDIQGHLSLSPDGRRLAFECGLKQTQICTVDADGKNMRPITVESRGLVGYAAWSPDGREIAFYKNADGRTSLQIASVGDGSQRERFGNSTAGGRFWELAWSPDGRWLAWSTPAAGMEARQEIRIGAASGSGNHEPFRVDLGSSVRPSVSCPRWFPDGKKVAFTAQKTVHQVLLVEHFLPRAVPNR